MSGKILIIDGSDFKGGLIKVVNEYNEQNPSRKINYVALPNDKTNKPDDIKRFVECEVNEATYDVVFCHLRWISDKIEPLQNLKESQWFKPILNIENRVGVSNASGFRDEAEELGLFDYLYCHEGAKCALIEFLK